MSRMPMVTEIVKSIYSKEPSRAVNPDEAVAMGAAIQAGVLKGDVKDILLLDVTPLSLGIETLGGVFTRLISRNTTIPTKKSQVFSTAADNQTQVGIKVLQGEREMAADNQMLGQFDLVGIPPAPRGVPQIEVTFDIDANGICNVGAKDKATGKEQQVRIQSSGGLSKDEIERMVREAEQHQEADKKKRDAVQARNTAESQVIQAEKAVGEWKHVSEEEKQKVTEAIQELRGAMDLDGTEGSRLQELTDNLQKLVMECGKKDYEAAAAANAGASSSESSEQSSEQETKTEGEGEKKAEGEGEKKEEKKE